MRFKWSLWDFAKQYLLKVVLLWFAIISVFSIAVHFAVKFWLGRDIEAKYWVILVIVGVFLAQSVAYWKIARRQIPAERIEQFLVNVSKLRETGVNELQNVDVNSIRTANEYKKFEAKFLNWRENLVSEVDKVSPSQASIFQVLGMYQPVTISGYQGEVQKELEKLLGIITEYTKRIKEFTDQFSLENLANRVRE